MDAIKSRGSISESVTSKVFPSSFDDRKIMIIGYDAQLSPSPRIPTLKRYYVMFLKNGIQLLEYVYFRICNIRRM